MDEILITCPQCGHQFPLNDALAAQLKARLDAEHRARLEAAVREAESRARKAAALEKQQLEAHLAEQREKLEQAQRAELELRQKAETLETRARELDLELARRLDAKKAEWEARLREALGAEQDLKLKEKEKQIEDLRRVIDDLKRRSEQGSQERQGEVLELDIESVLAARFPADEIRPVKKGARGADVVQIVRNESLAECGAIVWEAKNAKNWQPAWIGKLKDDQREAGAALAVLVATALPEGVRGFGCVDGVWVADLATYPALGAVLRAQLIEVARARAVSTGVSAKMEALYGYLTGHEFRHRVEAIVEAFSSMQQQLARERRAMEKQWAEREKQIDRVITSTTAMYGALARIVGSSLPTIPALALEGPDHEEEKA